jgi:hypothetical protein
LEEIDYIQRMIPKKIIEENINRSIQTKRELNVNIEDMILPAAKIIADKITKKLPKDFKITEEIKPEATAQTTNTVNINEKTQNARNAQKADNTDTADNREIINAKQPVNSNNRIVKEDLKPREEKYNPYEAKEIPLQRNKIIQSKPSAVSAFARDAKSKRSIIPKTEKTGMYSQQRNWKNFAYIKDSKVKLKQDDLLSINKTIMDIEQGKLSLKGI